MERRSFEFRADEIAPDGSTFSGWASAFNTIDRRGTIMGVTAFDRTLDDFLARGFVAGLNHDWSCPIGAPVEARTDPSMGLWVKGELVPTEAGKQSQILLAHKLTSGRPVIQSLSIGFVVLSSRRCQAADPIRAYWDSVGYTPSDADLEALAIGVASGWGITILDAVKLYEVSPVTVPANALATIVEARTGDIDPIRRRQEIDLSLRLRLALASL